MRAKRHGGKPKVPGKPAYPQRRSPEEFREMGADVINIGKIRKKRSIWAIDCSPRCLVYPIDSKASKLVQAADLSTSSLGHALLPSGKGSSRYFDEIRNRTINVHGKPGASTQQTPTGFNRDSIVSEGQDLNIVNSTNADKTSANGHPSGRYGTANGPSKKSKSGSNSKSESVKTKTKQTKGAR